MDTIFSSNARNITIESVSVGNEVFRVAFTNGATLVVEAISGCCIDTGFIGNVDGAVGADIVRLVIHPEDESSDLSTAPVEVVTSRGSFFFTMVSEGKGCYEAGPFEVETTFVDAAPVWTENPTHGVRRGVVQIAQGSRFNERFFEGTGSESTLIGTAHNGTKVLLRFAKDLIPTAHGHITPIVENGCAIGVEGVWEHTPNKRGYEPSLSLIVSAWNTSPKGV